MDSFEVILPFLAPIAHLISDPSVSEIMRNNDGSIYTERGGLLRHEKDLRIGEADLVIAVENIARVLNSDVDDVNPILDSWLPDGSRVAAVLSPVSLGGSTMTIRKFDARRFTLPELVRIGSIDEQASRILREQLHAGLNILISGGTSSGKTTLLNALSPYLGDVRLVVIEDTAELQLHQKHVVRFVSRQAKPNLPEIPIRQLVKTAMRFRPDRIIVGETRGPEAMDLLAALNSGHGGSMTTIHAETARRAITKLATYALQSQEMPIEAVHQMIAESIHVIVQLRRDCNQGRRYVSEIVRVDAYDRTTDQFSIRELWRDNGPALASDSAGLH